MGAHRYAASHVNHDKPQGLVGLSDLLGIPLGHRLLIEGVEDAHSGKLRHAGIPCDGHQLVHHHGIHDIGGNPDGISDLLGQNAPQIGGVLPLHSLLQILQKSLRHGVGAAGNGLEHAAPPYHYVQGSQIKVFRLQQIRYDFLAEILLVHYGGISGNLLRGMPQGLLEQKVLILKNTDLGGGGTGIDNQAFNGHFIFLPLLFFYFY